MAFYVGQKVVCIAKGDWEESKALGEPHPIKNKIYTIRQIVCFEEPGLRLVEIVLPPRGSPNGVEETAWAQREFRPLVERKTDISIFWKILKGECLPEAINS